MSFYHSAAKMNSAQKQGANAHFQMHSQDNSVLLEADQTPLTAVRRFQLFDYIDDLPSSPDSLCNYYFTKALEQYRKAEYFSAIHTFKRSLAYDSGHFESVINLGVCYNKLQLLDEAIVIFSKAIKQKPNNYVPYLNKALCELQLQEYPKVINTVDNALKVLSDPPEELFKIRTYVLYQSGKITNILEELRTKNGFEPKKRASSRRVVETYSVQKTCLRPRTSSYRKHALLHLFPESQRSFVEVGEANVRHNQKPVSAIVSHSSSPTHTSKAMSNKRSKPKIQENGLGDFEPKNKVNKELGFRVPTSETKPVFKPGIIQINVLQRYEEYLDNKESAAKFQKNIKALQHYVEHDFERADELKVDDEDTSFISEQEIKLLVEEFSKSARNYQQIDRIAVKLEFLQKFPLEMRESIYDCASIKQFAPNEVIFNEGDTEQDIFVIIKGSVAINKRMLEVRNYPIIIASLYDGRQFGDISILDDSVDKEVCKHTCIVTELSVMLIIPKKDYKTFIFQYLKPELEAKAKFLTSVRLFKAMDQPAIYNIASTAIINRFNLGDVILKKGDLSKGLYVISKGYVEAVSEGKPRRCQNLKIFDSLKKRVKSPRPFYTGNVSPNAKSRPVGLEMNKPQKAKEKLERSFQTNIVNYILHQTEYFGGRTLLDRNATLDMVVKTVPSKHTFIANSSEVEVIIITKEMLQFLVPDTRVDIRK